MTNKPSNFLITNSSTAVTGGERDWREGEEDKGVKCRMTEGDWTSDGEHTMKYVDHVLYNCNLNL